MTKSIVIAAVFALATFAPGDGIAFAQAGSIGGTIGKTDKSISGDNDSGHQPPPRQHGAKKIGTRISKRFLSKNCWELVVERRDW